MSSTSARELDAARRRRRLTRAIKESLRELSNQLSLLNHHVGAHVELDDQLELLADFLRRTTDAGQTATDELAAD
jgi:hypothetical protein